MIFFLNGRFLPAEKAKVPVLDHGFLYGDGVFETVRSYNGKVFRLNDHLFRLRRSAARLRIRLPYSGSRFSDILRLTLARNRKKDALLRITLTRGAGPPGLEPSLCPKPTVLVMIRPFKGHPETRYQKGLTATISDIRRTPPESLDPAIKSGNFLNNILARFDSLDRKTDEGIMLTIKGYLAEGTISNLFFISRGRLYTPHLSLGVLPGISRKIVIGLAKKSGFSVTEGRYRPARLFNADECFLTNTSMEVMPVVKVDGKQIGKGSPGPITGDLHAAYRLRVIKECSGGKGF